MKGLVAAALALVASVGAAAGPGAGTASAAAHAAEIDPAQLCQLLKSDEIQSAIGRQVSGSYSDDFTSRLWGNGKACFWTDPSLNEAFDEAVEVQHYARTADEFNAVKKKYVDAGSASGIRDLGDDAFAVGRADGNTAQVYVRLARSVLGVAVVTDGRDPLVAAEKLARLVVPRFADVAVKAVLKTWQKNAFRVRARALTALARSEAAAAFRLTIHVGDSQIATPASTLLLQAASLHRQQAFKLQNLAADPPDPHFRALPRVRSVSIDRVRPHGRLTRTRAAVLNAYSAALARVGGLQNAVLTAVERAQGASAAGSRKWRKRQMLAAARDAGALARLLGALSPRTKAAAAALKAAGMSVTVTREDAAEDQRRIATDGIPADFQKRFFDAFRRFGREGSTVADAFAAELLGASPDQLTGRFPAAWVAPKTLRSYRSEAKAMRAFAHQARVRPFAGY